MQQEQMEPEQTNCVQCVPSAGHCVINRSMVNCESQFKRYQWIREMAKGIGEHGIIYLVYNRERSEETVIKVQAYLETFPSATARCDNEMMVACVMTGHQGFLRLYNHWICNVQPDAHVFRRAARKPHLRNQAKLYYMEMERANGTLQELIEDRTPMTRLDKLVFLFELVYVLNQARLSVGFYHGDLNTGNIFYEYAPTSRSYFIQDPATGGPFEVELFCPVRPLVGDFGTSKLRVTDPVAFERDMEWVFSAAADWGIRTDILSRELKALMRTDVSYHRLLYSLVQHMQRAQEKEQA